jgi:hypothetical protein
MLPRAFPKSWVQTQKDLSPVLMGVDETTIKSEEGQVECTVLNLAVNGVSEGRVVDLGSLYAALAQSVASVMRGVCAMP